MRRDPFQAIADPTRREIISIVSRESLNLNALSERFRISRPAISKQIKILCECGLITIKQEGRERYCEANLRELKEVYQWIDQYRSFWTSRLDALGEFLGKSGTSKAQKRKTSKRSSITSKKIKRK